MTVPPPETIEQVAEGPRPGSGLLSLDYIAKALALIARHLVAIERVLGDRSIAPNKAPPAIATKPNLQPMMGGGSHVPSTPDGAAMFAPDLRPDEQKPRYGTMVEAVVEVLRLAARPLAVCDVHAALEEAGFRNRGNSVGATLFNLMRTGKVTRTGEPRHYRWSAAGP